MCAVQTAGGVGDVGELYGSLSGRLEQIVRHDVHASETVIEDACQVAWGRLVVHASRVSSDGALSWLATTAVREARRLTRRTRRDVPLDDAGEGLSGWRLDPVEWAEQREQLATLARLPQRQRQMIWLQGAGLSYAEIASATGCTLRTVERQLLRAKRSLREV